MSSRINGSSRQDRHKPSWVVSKAGQLCPPMCAAYKHAPDSSISTPDCILWSQSKQRNEVADAKPVVLTLKVKFFKDKNSHSNIVLIVDNGNCNN